MKTILLLLLVLNFAESQSEKSKLFMTRSGKISFNQPTNGTFAFAPNRTKQPQGAKTKEPFFPYAHILFTYFRILIH